MGALWALLTSKLAGPILGGGLVLALIGGGVLWAVDSWKISSLESDKAKLESSINDPKTGYVVRNAQCETNVAQLSGAVDRQTASLRALQAEGVAAEARWRAALALASKGATAAQAAAARILALKPTKPVCDAALELLRSPAQ